MTPPASGLADRLLDDLDALAGALRSPLTAVMAASLVALVIAAWRLRRALAHDRRLTPRARAVSSVTLSAFTLAVAVMAVVGFLWWRAPLLFGVALASVVGAAAVSFTVRGRGWLWGLAAIWRGRIRIGDRLRVGEVEGSVAEAGIFGVTVVSDDGARIYLPNARLARDTYAVASPEQVHPAEVTVRAPDHDLDDAALETIRRIGLLCPYRQSSSAVAVELAEDRRSATVRFRAWSEEGAQAARSQVQAAFAAAVARHLDTLRMAAP